MEKFLLFKKFLKEVFLKKEKEHWHMGNETRILDRRRVLGWVIPVLFSRGLAPSEVCELPCNKIQYIF